MKARHQLPRTKLFSLQGKTVRKLLMPVLVLVILKIAFFTSFSLKKHTMPFNDIFSDDVAAQENQAQTVTVADIQNSAVADNGTKKWDVDTDFEWSFDLVKAVKERQSELNIRQDEVQKEEDRLKSLQTEIEGQIQKLVEVEKRISELVAQKKAIEDEKVRKLAKVFEATPPEQAGPLMSKLDVDIAAELLLKMQGRKAGRIWGFVEPDKAVMISKELARLDPEIDMEKMSKQ